MPSDGGPGTKLITELKGIDDEGSLQMAGLLPSPWLVESPQKQADLVLAFQLNVKLLELGKVGPVGVQHTVFGTLELPKETAPAIASKQKIVDPEAPDTRPANVFKTIDQAVAFVNPGDEILLKHAMNKRELDIDPVHFAKPNADVTFKPYPGYSPILTLAPTNQPDAALFHVHDQKIQFENLELELQVDQ